MSLRCVRSELGSQSDESELCVVIYCLSLSLSLALSLVSLGLRVSPLLEGAIVLLGWRRQDGLRVRSQVCGYVAKVRQWLRLFSTDHWRIHSQPKASYNLQTMMTTRWGITDTALRYYPVFLFSSREKSLPS